MKTKNTYEVEEESIVSLKSLPKGTLAIVVAPQDSTWHGHLIVKGGTLSLDLADGFSFGSDDPTVKVRPLKKGQKVILVAGGMEDETNSV